MHAYREGTAAAGASDGPKETPAADHGWCLNLRRSVVIHCRGQNALRPFDDSALWTPVPPVDDRTVRPTAGANGGRFAAAAFVWWGRAIVRFSPTLALNAIATLSPYSLSFSDRTAAASSRAPSMTGAHSAAHAMRWCAPSHASGTFNLKAFFPPFLEASVLLSISVHTAGYGMQSFSYILL